MSGHRAGPVRSEAAREAILSAAARIFQRAGYEQMTIEGIAKEAGVGKQTIYRWWPSRGALIAECLSDGRLLDLELTVPDTGDLIADVEHWLTALLTLLETPDGASLLRSLVAAAAEDAAVGDFLSVSLGVERYLIDRLAIGVRAGQLASDAPIEELGLSILGTLILRVISRKGGHERPMRRLIRFLLAPATA